jgi:hypothetical protein
VEGSEWSKWVVDRVVGHLRVAFGFLEDDSKGARMNTLSLRVGEEQQYCIHAVGWCAWLPWLQGWRLKEEAIFSGVESRTLFHFVYI